MRVFTDFRSGPLERRPRPGAEFGRDPFRQRSHLRAQQTRTRVVADNVHKRGGAYQTRTEAW